MGCHRCLQVDNDPEFISKALDEWAHRRGVKLSFSRLGTPTDNPYIEAWRIDYNEVRPRTALGNQTPTAYKAAYLRNQPREETG